MCTSLKSWFLLMHHPLLKTITIPFSLCPLHLQLEVFLKGMTTLKELFPDPASHGNRFPTNVIIDNSSAEVNYLYVHISFSSKHVAMAFMQ